MGAEAAIRQKLSEDYNPATSQHLVDSKPWFGRCVFESDNDVCDEQVVTMAWDSESDRADQSPNVLDTSGGAMDRGAKTAIFHMVAHTKKICQRYTHIYGEDGEIYADSKTITVEDFRTGRTEVHTPPMNGGGHGGGDNGLALQFVRAVDAVKNYGMSVTHAQNLFVGCDVEDVVRSHAAVFAAEESRKRQTVVHFQQWWETKVKARRVATAA